MPMGMHGTHTGFGETGPTPSSVTLIGGAIVGGYIVDGLLTNYMVGGNFSKKEIARRSAIVGVLLGIPTYWLISTTQQS